MQENTLKHILENGEYFLKDLLLNNYGVTKSKLYKYSSGPSSSTLNKIPVVFYFGMAGAGKTTCLEKVFETDNNKHYLKLKTSTNRPRRDSEPINKYNWLDIKSLADSGCMDMESYKIYITKEIKKNNLNFIELDFRETGYIYGVLEKDLIESIEYAQTTGKLLVIEIEVRGLSSLKNIFLQKRQEAIDTIFITPPIYNSIYNRLTDNNNRDGLLIRLQKNIDELQVAKELATTVLINVDGDISNTIRLLKDKLDSLHKQFYNHN